MPRLALLNIFCGFVVLFLAASFGAFVAFDTTESFLRDRELYDSWKMLIERHSHGHANLFGMMQIMFGLTLSYSKLSGALKWFQSSAFLAGIIAMGPMMMIRAQLGPTDEIDVVEVVTGSLLSLTFVAILLHCYGLGQKLLDRQ